MDVGQDTTLCDGDVAQKLVQLLIVPDGQLQMPGNDTGLLVVASGVASQLENLGSQVLENSSQVHGGTGTNTLSVVALAEQTVNTANRERQTGLGGTTARVSSWTEKPRAQHNKTYVCEFLEPLALPPDLPPPVILIDLVRGVGGLKREGLREQRNEVWIC